jgi:hypothetical protein
MPAPVEIGEMPGKEQRTNNADRVHREYDSDHE